MKCRNRGDDLLTAIRSRLASGEPIVTAALAVPPSLAGVPDHTERRDTMRRIKHSSRTIVVFGVMLATALLAAAFPLVAWAGDGGPVGM